MSPLRNTSLGSSKSRLTGSRRPLATLIGLGLAGLTALAAACGDAPSAPRTALSAGDAPSLLASTGGTHSSSSTAHARGLKRSTTLQGAQTASQVIGPEGGVLRLRDAGLTLSIPEGAVSAPTAFRVTAIAGDVMAYEFEPHGTRFAVPLKFEQDIKGTTADRGNFDGQLEGAYFTDASKIDAATGLAVVSEFLPLSIDRKTNKVKMYLEHFSGYMVSTGRH